MKRNQILLLILCLLIGFALRLYTFDQKSLWMDEVNTYNSSQDDLRGQLQFYRENSTYLHPPLFYILTHLFHPFDKPERDLRILPLIFGILSIPMLYFLARLFSPAVALPCTLSLTFMTYHISLSQDGRSYALIMFLGMAGLYFFVKHLNTWKKGYLVLAAFLYSILFYTSYSSIPFMAFSQILWLYHPREEMRGYRFPSFLMFNALIFFFCLPWLLFVVLHYTPQPIMDPFHTEDPGSFWSILYGVLQDWVPLVPLMASTVVLLLLFPLFAQSRRNALVLLAVFILPIAGLYLFCKLLDVTHFVTSRYFINFLSLFFVTIYLALYSIELRVGRLRKFFRLRLLFIILFIASNLIMLSHYYRAEKQDLRGLAAYLRNHLREGDKIFMESAGPIPGLLHYLGSPPKGRFQMASSVKDPNTGIEHRIPFVLLNRNFTIYYSKRCCEQYVADGSRLWIVVCKETAKRFEKESPAVFKGYFDGTFLNFNKFPTDASFYLFLWDPRSPDGKGIDMPIN
jgi:uncharacterized membrane protein